MVTNRVKIPKTTKVTQLP